MTLQEATAEMQHVCLVEDHVFQARMQAGFLLDAPELLEQLESLWDTIQNEKHALKSVYPGTPDFTSLEVNKFLQARSVGGSEQKEGTQT